MEFKSLNLRPGKLTIVSHLAQPNDEMNHGNTQIDYRHFPQHCRGLLRPVRRSATVLSRAIQAAPYPYGRKCGQQSRLHAYNMFN